MIPKSLHAFIFAVIICMGSAGCTAAGDGSSQLHTMTMMVPNTPGGGYDISARTVTNIMEKTNITGHIDVFNVVGSDETVALARLTKESGNPNLMMMMGLGMVGASYGVGSKYSPSDATALAELTEEPEAVVVAADSPFKTVDEAITAWKASPATFAIGGGSSRGGPNYLFPMELAQAVGIQPAAVKYVAYAGDGQMLPALLTGTIQFGASGLAEYRDQIAAGQVRVLAVSAAHRITGTTTPTLKDSGINLVYLNWHGVLAPPGISAAIRARLIDILTKLHNSPQWRQALTDNGWGDAFITGDRFARFIRAQERLEARTMKELDLPPKT
ncbi:MAG TPA: C4-dicarboxylate ABC transporter substrate-binding protein [Microbacteriaceae bacterium]|nr:C4-dicarboxylate ABC transporter substrate-binding protein [Microbacteriaceae bacterium]